MSQLRKLIPHGHQGKAKPVLPLPTRRVIGGGVILCQSSASDTINRAGFDQDAVTGLAQVRDHAGGWPKVWALARLPAT